MKTIEIKKLTMKLWVLLSVFAFVKSYDYADDYSYPLADGSYERDTWGEDNPIILTIPEVQDYRQVKVYFKPEDDLLFVTQVNMPMDKPILGSGSNKPDLRIVVPITETVILHPLDINPKEIKIYHSKGYIIIYQGDQPPRIGPLSTEDDNSILYLNDRDYRFDKLIKIYYIDNKLYVTQLQTPDNKYLKSSTTSGSLLQYIGSDRAVVYLYPTKINWSKQVAVQHKGNSIFIFQGRKPQSDLRESSDETKYLPEELIPDFEATLDSEEIHTINSGDFNPKKTALIFFINGEMKITQEEAPIETDATLRRGIRSLQTMSPDANTLLFHPSRFSRDIPIRIQHKNNKIFVWTGSNQAPGFTINQPEIIDVMRPEVDSSQEYDTEIDSETILTVNSDHFNVNKLVRIFFINGKLKISQLGASEETDFTLRPNIRNLQTISPDTNTLLFHPSRFSRDIPIRIQHKNNKIFVWTGSNQAPGFTIERPEIIQVLNPEYDDNLLVTTPKAEYETSFDSGTTLNMYPRDFDLKKLVSIFFENGLLKITQIGTSNEMRTNSKYKINNLQIKSSDVNKLLLHPARIPEDQQINLRHENGNIYLWHGSDEILPSRNMNRPDVVEVIEPVPYFTADSTKTLTFSPGALNFRKLFYVIFKNNKLHVTLNNTFEESSAGRETSLPIIKSDKTPLIFHSNIFNMNLKTYMRHQNGKIYIWQGSDQLPQVIPDIPSNNEIKPKPVDVIKPKIKQNYTSTLPPLPVIKANGKNTTQDKIQSDYIITETHENIVNVSLIKFNPEKLTSVSFKNNTWTVTQKDASAETLTGNFNPSSLQIVRPDTETVYLHTKFINNSSNLHLRHLNGKIYIWQGDNQPKVEVPSQFVENLSSLSLSSVRDVTPSQTKTTINYNKTIANGKTLTMSSGEFDNRRLVLISYKDNSLHVTQTNLPEDTWERRTEFRNNLQVIQPDNETMYLHAGLTNLKSPINFRHENGKIYIWQGVKPTSNIETPILQVIDPNPPRTAQSNPAFDANYQSSQTVKKLSTSFDLTKLLYVSFENNKLHISQVGTPEESKTPTEGHKNLQIVKPDTVKVFIHLGLVNPNLLINIRHQNGKIYIWQGSDEMPNADIEMSDVVEIIKSYSSVSVVKDLDETVPDNVRITANSTTWNPDKLIVVKHENNKIHIYQIDRVDNAGETNPNYEDISLRIPDGKSATIDPRKINPKKMIIVNYLDSNHKTWIDTDDM